MRKNWTEHEIQYLTKSWGKVLLKQIMKTLYRTEDSVMRKARRMGLDVHIFTDNIDSCINISIYQYTCVGLEQATIYNTNFRGRRRG